MSVQRKVFQKAYFKATNRARTTMEECRASAEYEAEIDAKRNGTTFQVIEARKVERGWTFLIEHTVK